MPFVRKASFKICLILKPLHVLILGASRSAWSAWMLPEVAGGRETEISRAIRIKSDLGASQRLRGPAYFPRAGWSVVICPRGFPRADGSVHKSPRENTCVLRLWKLRPQDCTCYTHKRRLGRLPAAPGYRDLPSVLAPTTRFLILHT